MQGRGYDENQRRAKKVKREAVRADMEAEQEVEVEANSSRRRKREKMRANADQGDVEQEPLMEDEVTKSQEGVDPGELRAYAHRDIKPGPHAFICFLLLKPILII